MLLGAILGNFIPGYICNYIGAILLIAVGIWMTIDYYKDQKALVVIQQIVMI